MDGFSGQQGYSGPHVHTSEYIGGGLADHVRDNPGTYVAVVVECTHEYCDASNASLWDGTAECEPEGWGVLHKRDADDAKPVTQIAS